jgi:hypothetical protein
MFQAGDANLRRYVGNHPTNSIDPSGLDDLQNMMTRWDNWMAKINALGLKEPVGFQPPAGWNFLSWETVTNEIITLAHKDLGQVVSQIGLPPQPKATDIALPKRDWFASTSDFFAGWADTLTFGGTGLIRKVAGYDDAVDYNSGFYTAGQVTGGIHGFALGFGAGGYAPQAGFWAYRASQVYTTAGSVFNLGRSSYILITDPSSFGWQDALGFAPALGWSANMARLGNEIQFGRNFRLAPFGNRTGHPIGKWPHYHRRVIDPATGNTLPGGGIGRHRPWEGL